MVQAYEALGSIAKERPELAKDALATLNEALKFDKNNYKSLQYAYATLGKIVKAQPQLAKDVFTTFNETLKSDKNNSKTLSNAYISLRDIVKAQPQLAKDVFTTFNEALKSDENDYISLEAAYYILGDIVKTQPELSKDVFATFNEALKSDENRYNSLKAACSTLSDIVKTQPQLAKDVFTTFNEALKSDKNDSDSLNAALSTLQEIVIAQPELSKDVLATLNETLKSDKHDYNSLIRALSTLQEIVIAQPELSKDVLATLNETLKSDKHDYNSLMRAYSTLGDIVKAQPELSKDVLATFNEALKSDKNDYQSLMRAYRVLREIVIVQPQLAKDALTTLNEALKSDKNNYISLPNAYSTLSDIVKAQPQLANDVFATLNKTLKSYANNDNSLRRAYYSLGEIIKAQPQLTKDVVITIISQSNDINKICLLSRCMKKCKVEDFPEVTAEQKLLLQAAHVMRFSTEKEIEYLYNTQTVDKIAKMNLSAQQRCMNIMMFQLGKEQNLDTNEVKNFRENQDYQPYQDNADWLIPASLKAAEIFGCYFPSYIKQTQGYLNTHDSVYWLPKDMGKEKNQSFVSFVQNNLIYQADGEKKCRNLAEMEIIAKNWQYLTPEEEKLKYKDILAICRSRKYRNQEYANFATEAAKWGVDESRYKDFEDIYAAGLNVPEPFDSSKRFEFGDYCGRFLPRDDVRTGFFGGHTNCCQHFNGVGKACAISTVKDPYSQLFVIESKETGKIVAGSWVWENTEGTHRDVCFDNIEAIGDYARHPILNHIYNMVGKYLTEEENCRYVTIGMGYQDAETSKYKPVKPIPLPTQYDNQYSDAKGTQVLLAENPNAEPLDKSQESLRFIREACFLDWDAMDYVSQQCFPDGDKRLQSPERLTGLALVDKDKGIVGYCLYDKDERSIYDMAVLPEYRTDKNASSHKLFAEVIKKIKEIGGEWKAELRDKTTYQYMKIMQLRGLVSFETHGIDHEMSDGSKVYSVTFKINDAPTQNKKLQPNIQRLENDGR